jgi:4-deoxy-L-threo-5-hexosulose-uronate ketol-isomerase
MVAMEIREPSNSKDAKHYTTERLREEFHIEKIFEMDQMKQIYSHIDRIITIGINPVKTIISLDKGIDVMKTLGTDFYLQRRELGIINIGGEGFVTVDGERYTLKHKDGLYVGLGKKEVLFESSDINNPAKFYCHSAPAHKEYPNVHIDTTKAKKVPMGETSKSNKRVINQYIHPDVMETCQLSMGLTELEEGNVWNTMPCHTHERRMEVYMYFNLPEDQIVFHLMGQGHETRHIVMRNEEAVISPSWSIHSGCGTSAYSFIWGMVGENKTFNDMDHIDMKDIK